MLLMTDLFCFMVLPEDLADKGGSLDSTFYKQVAWNILIPEGFAL